MVKQNKKVFSIAGKYSRVLDILSEVDNQSEFICQAVIEKFDGKSVNSATDEQLEKRIRAILAEMVTDDCVIIAHKGELPKQAVCEEPAKPVQKEEESPDLDLIKNIANKW